MIDPIVTSSIVGAIVAAAFGAALGVYLAGRRLEAIATEFYVKGLRDARGLVLEFPMLNHAKSIQGLIDRHE